MEKYYDKVRTDMGAVRLSQQHWLRHSVWTELAASPGNTCLPADPQPHMAIKVPYSESEAGKVTEGEGGVKRETCAFDGDSFLGSRGGAKASVDFVYLAPVLNKGVVVRDMCEVARILPDLNGDAANGYSVHFSSLRERKNETVRAKRVILAAGTMNTLKLLFVSSAEPGGLSPMPSLGRTFGGNGDLFGAWFKESAQPPMFQTAPVLGRFKQEGRDVPFIGLAGLPGVDTLPLPPFVKRKLGKTVPILGMGADTGNASVRYRRRRCTSGLRSRCSSQFSKRFERLRALGAQSSLKTW